MNLKTLTTQGLELGNKIYSDSLYQNSIFLILSQVFLTGLGFLFWIVCSKIFSTEAIGIGTTLISITSLITNFSLLGFNTAIVRFLPKEKNKSEFVRTAFAIVSAGALLSSLIFIVGINFFSPSLIYIQKRLFLSILFSLFMVIASLNALTDSVFIAMRSTKYILFGGIFVGLVKLISPFIVSRFFSSGVFVCYAVSIVIALIISFAFVRLLNLSFYPKIDLNLFRKTWKFAAGNYLAGLFGTLNSTVTPIIITNVLGPSSTAFYYMPTMIITFLLTFPRSFSYSMFAEGSHETTSLRSLFFRSLKATYMIIIPAAVAIFFLGPFILGVFGKSYSAEGITYLRLTLVSVLISVPTGLFSSILYIKKAVKLTLSISIFVAITNLTITFFSLRFGLLGLGVAGILIQIVLLSMYATIFFLKFKR